MGKSVTITATEHLFESTTRYAPDGTAIRQVNVYHTTNDETGEVVAVRADPVVLEGGDLDTSKTIAQIPAAADTKKDADDAAKAALAVP